jgi:hypothetical protein
MDICFFNFIKMTVYMYIHTYIYIFPQIILQMSPWGYDHNFGLF